MNCPTFTITLPSELRMLSVARAFVEAVCQTWQMERSVLHALVLVTGEALTNIVRHAHRDQPLAQLEIRIEVCAEHITLTFLDQGQPFDINAVPHLNPSELRIGGRGVYLMRTLMDEVTCTPRGQQAGNMLRLVKRWSTAPASRLAAG
jgi:serine/threonine-protein kinase RsbW